MSETIAAIATPTGGAIGIIRISGERAFDIVGKIFTTSSDKALATAKGNTLHYGRIVSINELGSTEDIDDVLVSVFHAPHSYTGEDSLEISCHGSAYVMQRIMELLLQYGARQARPGEFTQRAFLNGKMDLSQAEAVADLIASHSAASQRLAIKQLRGGFSNELSRLREQLLHLTSLLELELDFSEEEVEFADRTELLGLSKTIHSHVTRLADSFRAGNAIKNGIPVAIIGAPNVGKSTLLNLLLNDEKAIVSHIKGTTRDLIEDTIQIHGLTFRFIDTAGIRNTRNQIEKIGIERSLQAAEKAQVIILLSDPDTPFPILDRLDGKDVIRVLNKCDKLESGITSSIIKEKPGIIQISALTGQGVSLLIEQLLQKSTIPQISENETIVTNLRHYEALKKSQNSIQIVIEGLEAGIPNDLIAQDLRECLHHLSEITGGEITSDEVLHAIFRNFCIGK